MRPELIAPVAACHKPNAAGVPQVAAFTEQEADFLRGALRQLLADAPSLARSRPAALRAEARRLGDEVLELERFVQLNQVGFRDLDGGFMV